ncbi:hypothetical protein TRFO_05272 [Tritrichomonas foetus]|uniref:Vta1/callose synthase N-terminal domain-containing protein n=1 Tax=Tritrichomonas foetus TaxID=1144522 RepID=A0A1J4KBL3_9EUKA|nr:hypothetical protein TRFO_05272 [Tritrichomonas foetus]|eukprot:OHT07076.1 hypothetical protein TRFO_05272 [Tritrichomonas foetus]
MSIPAEFRAYSFYVQAAIQLESRYPDVAAVMNMCFAQACQDIIDEGGATPEGEQFLEDFLDSHEHPPDGAVDQTKKIADQLFASISKLYNNGKYSQTLVKQFILCKTLYSVLDGSEPEERVRLCTEMNQNIRNALENPGAAPPPQIVQTPAENPQPAYNPPTASAPSPAAPPSYTPPAYTPPSYEPPSYNPPAYSPPAYPSPPSQPGPPVYTPTYEAPPPSAECNAAESTTSSSSDEENDPPIEQIDIPSGLPNNQSDPLIENISIPSGPPQYPSFAQPPAYPTFPQQQQPQQQMMQQMDPTQAVLHSSQSLNNGFDVDGARAFLSQLGYGVDDARKYPPLNQASATAVRAFLDAAIAGLRGNDTARASMLLKEAIRAWSGGNA